MTTTICTAWKFLSTLSLRRATFLSDLSMAALRHFYPRSPCGERLWLLTSILTSRKYFYPRSPCGERLTGFFLTLEGHKISIHALLAESDWVWTGGLSCNGNFYPRSPCGERLVGATQGADFGHISIHALLAESDNWLRTAGVEDDISIHALLAESDFDMSIVSTF